MNPCVDCGEKDVLVLEFDHIQRETKTADISTMLLRGVSTNTLVKEMLKCEVRCANCHRRKTQLENSGWKLTYAPVA